MALLAATPAPLESTSLMTKTMNTSNGNNLTIIQRFGGESLFEYVVYGMVEHLQHDDDPELYKKYFSNFDQESLYSIFKNFFKTIFGEQQQQSIEQQSEDDDDGFDDIDCYILLRFFRFIERGFTETDYDKLMAHFYHAMEDGWVDDDLMRDSVAVMKSHRDLFNSTHKQSQ